jgi:hypothetical protein
METKTVKWNLKNEKYQDFVAYYRKLKESENIIEIKVNDEISAIEIILEDNAVQ